MAIPHGFATHESFSERRHRVDRRLGERRCRSVPVQQDRRRGLDRRRRIDRREGPAGHIRNALQMLTAIAYRELVGDEATDALNGAIDRLWRALPEIDRLQEGRRELGEQIRRRLERPEDRGTA